MAPSSRVKHSTTEPLRSHSTAGFIRVREMSGKFKFFQGQGIVREFYVVSVKNGYLLKCQGNVREFYNISSLYQMMRNRNMLGQFSQHFGYKLNNFDSF